jgi:hypothetical protein
LASSVLRAAALLFFLCALITSHLSSGFFIQN